MKKLKLFAKRLRSKGGFSYILASVMIIVVLLIGFAIAEIIRINIQAAAVRDKFEDAIISMCVNNYPQVYQTVREGTAASYSKNGSGTSWVARNSANETYIRNYLKAAMNSGEIMQCTINSIDFAVEPATLAPSNVDTAEKYSVAGTIKITIPYDFAWSDLTPISLTLNVKSVWRARF